MAQTPVGGLYGPPSKGPHGVCAIYSETTVDGGSLVLLSKGFVNMLGRIFVKLRMHDECLNSAFQHVVEWDPWIKEVGSFDACHKAFGSCAS